MQLAGIGDDADLSRWRLAHACTGGYAWAVAWNRARHDLPGELEVSWFGAADRWSGPARKARRHGPVPLHGAGAAEPRDTMNNPMLNESTGSKTT
jgi:hypothetical protein